MSDKEIFPANKVKSDFGGSHEEAIAPYWRGSFQCVSPEGVKWEDKWANSVQNVGRSSMMQRFFALPATNANQSVWYVFPHSVTPVNFSNSSIGNVSVSEVTGWSAGAGYTAGSRLGLSLASANITSNSFSTAFSIAFNGAGPYTVAGIGMVDNAGNAQTAAAGVLYSIGNFAGGSRQVQQNDTLNVTLTLSMG